MSTVASAHDVTASSRLVIGGPSIKCDVVIVGSGAAGLAAAITARHYALDVVVIEKEGLVGGTTAWSGGWLWLPGNPVSTRAGATDEPASIRLYLRGELEHRYDARLIDTFLSHGPKMIDFFERHSEARFVPGLEFPDFHPDRPGAKTGGRAICAAPYDARRLGPHIAKLRSPVPELTLLGMPLSAAADMKHFLNVFRSGASARHVARRVLSYAGDLLRHGRAMTLFNGNALVASLMKSALDSGVRIETATRCEALIMEDGRCTGVAAQKHDGPLRIAAARGVVLACGGFPHSIEWKKALFAHAPTGREHWSAAPASNTGDGLHLAVQAGATIDSDMSNAAAWVPVSEVRRRDGSVCNFPHLVDRGRPGVIAVTRNGSRFVNESLSYHDFMQGLFRATAAKAEVVAFLLCDHRALRRYGLGFAKPFPFPVWPYVRNGYLVRARTLAELATKTGIDPVGLTDTVAAFNANATRGEDPVWRRGETVYQRFMGDSAHGPNPCLAPLATAPFYAVPIRPGSLGTFAGIKTDERARVLDRDGASIDGLYAVGNDMASIMKGSYPGGGVTLGPAMTFGYVAALDLAGQLDEGLDSAPVWRFGDIMDTLARD